MIYKGFNSWLRQFVSGNVFLYIIWFYSVRKRKGDPARLPSRSDDLYFDGYPRSGNTFFANLIRSVYPTKNFGDHLHVVSGLKMALNFKLPAFVIIRKPKDAVISNLYRKIVDNKETLNHDLIERLLISYCNYYDFVKINLDDIHLMKFETCIKNEVLVVKKISELAGFRAISDEVLEEAVNDFKTLMIKKEDEKDPYASSLPNKQRQRFKKENLSRVINSPSYKRTKNIYDDLIIYDILLE